MERPFAALRALQPSRIRGNVCSGYSLTSPNDIASLRLQDAWRECGRHVYHLFHAMTSRRTYSPLSGATYAQLSDEQIQDVDQFILRFTKLQDTIGTRLFPAILHYLNEPVEDLSMLDKLNRLEKLGFIDNVEKWQTVRTIRNKFAHDYPDDPDKNAAQLNLAFASVSDLYAMLTTASARLQSTHPEFDLGKSLPPSAD